MDNSKLIIIRGPSGSGKSTIAKLLKEKSYRPTLLVEQDLFRQNFNTQGPASSVPVWQMIEANVMIGLNHGFDVILEGILNIQKPANLEVLERILTSHPNENYIFYLDVSFDETLKRHSSRDKSAKFGGADMKEWWPLASKFKHPKEIIISEQSSLNETLNTIASKAKINLTNI